MQPDYTTASYSPSPHQNDRSFLRKWWPFIVVAVLFLGVLYFVLTHGFLSVSVSGGDAVSFQIVNQNTGAIIDINPGSPRVSRLVPKGSYEVMARQGEKSSFMVAGVSGLLRTTSVSSTIQPEHARTFVGNNPGPCSYYLHEVLYSYGCSGSSNKTKHVPATKYQPTYSLPSKDDSFGDLVGTVKTKEGVVAVYRFNGTSEIEPYTAFIMKEGVKATDGVALSDLNQNDEYSIQLYREGFVAYNKDFTDILYYPSVNSKPQKINVGSPSDTSFRPYSLETAGDTLLVSYVNKSDYLDTDNPSTKPGEVKAALFIYKNGNVRTVSLTKKLHALYSNVLPCGTDKVCLVSDHELSVYDTSGQKASYIFTVSKVNSIYALSDKTLVLRDSEVIDLDVNNQTGYVSYSLGTYKACGLSQDSAAYILCASNDSGKVIALRLNTTETDNGAIDKQVQQLEGLPEVKDVSINHSYVFITPELGDLQYNPASGNLEPAPGTKQSAKEKINQKVDELGIDRKRYGVKIIGVD